MVGKSVRLDGVSPKKAAGGGAIAHYRLNRGELQDNTLAIAFTDTAKLIQQSSIVQVRHPRSAVSFHQKSK